MRLHSLLQESNFGSVGQGGVLHALRELMRVDGTGPNGIGATQLETPQRCRLVRRAWPPVQSECHNTLTITF